MKLAIFALLLAGASAKSSLVFEANGASCNFAFTGKVLDTNCKMGAGFDGPGKAAPASASVLKFDNGNKNCGFAFDGKVLTTDCSLDAGFKGTAPKSVSGDAQLVFEEADGSKCAMAYTGGKVVTNCNLGKGFQTDRPCNADGGRQTDRSDFGKSWGTPVSIRGNYRSYYGNTMSRFCGIQGDDFEGADVDRNDNCFAQLNEGVQIGPHENIKINFQMRDASNDQGGWRFWGGGLENGVNQFQDDYVRVHYKKQASPKCSFSRSELLDNRGHTTHYANHHGNTKSLSIDFDNLVSEHGLSPIEYRAKPGQNEYLCVAIQIRAKDIHSGKSVYWRHTNGWSYYWNSFDRIELSDFTYQRTCGASKPASVSWHLDSRSPRGTQSCDVVCADNGKSCDQASLSALKDPAAWVDAFDAWKPGHCRRWHTGCRNGRNCARWGAPFIHSSHVKDQICWRGDAKNAAATCAQRPVDGHHRRLCPCK
jgi:hypothetical protein